MRVVILAVTALIALNAAAECISVTWTPRKFISGSTDVVRAVGTDAFGIRVSQILSGKNVRVGDVVSIPPAGCCASPVAGTEYYARRSCYQSDCRWQFVEVERGIGFEDYLARRHYVSREEVMQKLRAWRRSALPTEDFVKWLATADVNDSDVAGDSLAMAAVESAEELLHFVRGAEKCSPGEVAHFQDFGAKVLIDRLARLPRQQKLSEYEAWLDAHPDADDEWDAEQVERDVRAAWKLDAAWRNAEECVYLRPQR